jgi:hypothetical protein
VPQRPALTAALGVLIVTGAGVIAARFVLGAPYEQDVRSMTSDSAALREARARLSRIDHAFAGDLSGGGFVIAAVDRAAARRAVAEMRAHDAVLPAGEKLFGTIRTLDDLLPADQDAKLAVLADIRAQIDALPDADRAGLAELRPPDGLRPIGDGDVPALLASLFTEKDGTRGRLILADLSSNFDGWKIADLIRFAGAVRQLDLGDSVALGGGMFVFADVLRSMNGDGPLATLAALLGAVAVVATLVGLGIDGAITLACCLAGTLGLLACASLAGLRVNFLDFIALPITLGIGIDYSVNIVVRARGEELMRSVETVGSAVVMCSFTTVVGYASLLMSANRGIRSFGTAAMLGELTCVAAAVALAPALLSLARRRKMPVPSAL